MLYQLLPRFDYQFQAGSMRMFLKTLSVAHKENFKTKMKNLFNQKSLLDYCFIIDCQKNKKGSDQISFYFRINHDHHEESVANSLQILFQDKADVFLVEELEPYTTVHTLYVKDKQSEVSVDGEKHMKRLATFHDDQIFMYILGSLQHNTRITIDFSVRKSKASSIKHTFKNKPTDVEVDTLIRISGKTKYQRNIIMGISNNVVNLTAGEISLTADYRNSYKFSTLTGNEIMNLIQMPTLSKKEENETMKRINKLLTGQRTLKEHEFANGIRCGKVSHPMQERDVYISEKQARKHMFVTGMTGSGKSSVVEEMCGDILLKKARGDKNVLGFSFFDPAEVSVLGILDKLLKLKSDGYDIEELTAHIHYVDFNYDECIFPISLLNKGMPATEIIDLFKMLYGDQQAIQVDRNMTSSINALLLDRYDHNVTDIQRIFQDPDFREELIQSLSDNPYAEDAINFLRGKFNRSITDPILNRTDPFLNTPKKKLMFGLNKSMDGLKDLKKWLDDGDIILYNMKGLNDFDRKTIIGYICSKYYTVGLTRADGALLHLVFIDESHKVQIPILQKILAELRKNGVALCPMTQYLDQYDEKYLQALLGNVGTKISFRQGDDAARRLVNNIPGNIDRESLKRLIDCVGFVSTEDDSEMKSVLIKVNPPYRYTNGKLVPFPDESPNKHITSENLAKNRSFGRSLMTRDFVSRPEAEQIVFHKLYTMNDQLALEQELLEEGDALWDQ